MMNNNSTQENTSISHFGGETNSKEMEVYNQPILWPSLKQKNEGAFELKKLLLDEFIDLQLNPLLNVHANYG